MSSSIWNKDTLLDISVNIIPLFIIAFFIAVYLVFDPFEGPSLARYIQMAIMVIIGVGLAILTYMAAVRIEGEEEPESGETTESAH